MARWIRPEKRLDRMAVYIIRHTSSGKTYVGSSIDYLRRWAGHRCDLKAGRHHSLLLQRAWNKYGPKAFIFEILEIVTNVDLLDESELRWIEELQPAYNRTLSTNRHCLGRKNGPLSEETKQKIREKVTGFRHTEETKAKLRGKGGSLKLSPEQRQFRAEQARTLFLGKTHTEEARAKISEAGKGRKASDETKAKRSASLKGKPWSEARRISEEKRLRIKRLATFIRDFAPGGARDRIETRRYQPLNMELAKSLLNDTAGDDTLESLR